MTEPDRARHLILMRHAKAEQVPGKADSERELTTRGRRDAEAAGRWLAEHDLGPDVVLCSTSSRTRQTWECVLAGGVQCGDVRYESALYNGGGRDILDLVTEAEPDTATVLVIGHAPGVPRLARSLARDDDGGSVPVDAMAQLDEGLPTSAMAVLAVRGAWSDVIAGSCDLLDVVVPRG